MKLNILIADDEILLREIFFDYFVNQEYRVLLADTFSSAKEILEKEEIKLVIADFKLFSQTYKLAEFIINNYRDIPIIFLASYFDEIQASKLKTLGIETFFLKPIKLDILNNAVEKLLQSQKILEENKQLKETIKKLKLNNQEKKIETYPPQESQPQLQNRYLNRPLIDFSIYKSYYTVPKIYEYETSEYKNRKAQEEMKLLDQLFQKGNLTPEELKKKKEILKKNGNK